MFCLGLYWFLHIQTRYANSAIRDRIHRYLTLNQTEHVTETILHSRTWQKQEDQAGVESGSCESKHDWCSRERRQSFGLLYGHEKIKRGGRGDKIRLLWQAGNL